MRLFWIILFMLSSSSACAQTIQGRRLDNTEAAVYLDTLIRWQDKGLPDLKHCPTPRVAYLSAKEMQYHTGYTLMAALYYDGNTVLIWDEHPDPKRALRHELGHMFSICSGHSKVGTETWNGDYAHSDDRIWGDGGVTDGA